MIQKIKSQHDFRYILTADEYRRFMVIARNYYKTNHTEEFYYYRVCEPKRLPDLCFNSFLRHLLCSEPEIYGLPIKTAIEGEYAFVFTLNNTENTATVCHIITNTLYPKTHDHTTTTNQQV